MANLTKGTFKALDIEANIYRELSSKKPHWWELFINDSELYIDIRKDNYINVYYYGGSVAKIKYQNTFKAITHQKYLGDMNPRKISSKGKKVYEYDELDLGNLSEQSINRIKNNIKTEYLKQVNNEKPAEKWVQGKLITEVNKYIDSEFQFNSDNNIGKLRIDLIELDGNQLSLVELKRITDSRLRNDETRNPNPPEIIDQINKYQLFIDRYFLEIENYYKSLTLLKNKLGLISHKNLDFRINRKPKLLIANTYQKITKGRSERIIAIEKLLKQDDIDYKIIKWDGNSYS